MDGLTDDAIRRNAQWAGCMRVFAFLFLMLSTLMIVHVDQFHNDSALEESPMGGTPRAPARFQWQVAPFLRSKANVVTTAYVTSSEDFAAIFRSPSFGAKTDSLNSDLVTQLVVAVSNMSYVELPVASDEELKQLHDPEDMAYFPQQTAAAKRRWSASILSIAADVTPQAVRNPFFKFCAGEPRCYVSLSVDARPTSTCSVVAPGSSPLSAASWSCLTPTEASLPQGDGDGATRNRETKDKQCVRVDVRPSISALQAALNRSSQVADDGVSVLRFCGRPVQQLLAVDTAGSRIFFVQQVDAPSAEDTTTATTTFSPTTSSTEEHSLATHSSQWLGFCIVTVHLGPYRDISECVRVPVPAAVVVDPLRPPVYIHYDFTTNALVVFYFDITESLIVAVLDTLPYSKGLHIRFSARLARLESSWLLMVRDEGESLVLLLGDKPPYLGVLHALDLISGRDIRLDVGMRRTRLRKK